jgi:L-alanine-DL-glutamate epimerase-like enolase superfamily enzyme
MIAPRLKVLGVKLWFLPVSTRVPLKFGAETLTEVTCARVCLRVEGDQGQPVMGWGETPLSVQWVWPGALPYALRHERLKAFCRELASDWLSCSGEGHALEIGWDFNHHQLPKRLAAFNRSHPEPMPWLAALVCNSAFDIALHDAFGNLVQKPIYQTYTPEFFSRDLASYLEPALTEISFKGRFPADFLVPKPPTKLPVWHLVGGLDAVEPGEEGPDAPRDGHPVLLRDWIKRDGLRCLKIKLRGTDSAWDYARLCQVGRLGLECGVEWFSADFNCTVRDPGYVNEILDRLRVEEPLLYAAIRYVEQPFAYELERDHLDVRSVSARKPLFLDESAHDWQMVRLGRELGWTGVALKTCKTQTGAILSACWAKAHKMELMVQDLTNPMLAQIPHVLLAANVGTIMGVETNAMQFYPEASNAEAIVHPGLYQRRNGMVDFGTIWGDGFGYRTREIKRALPEADLVSGDMPQRA